LTSHQITPAKHKIITRNMSGLSPDALCRTFKIRFDSKLKFLLTQSKILCC